MVTEKIVNYTPELTQELLAKYADGWSIEKLALELNKSKPSIVAKLVREGVYKTTEASTKPKRYKKAEMIQAIERYLELPEGTLETLEKASHEALTTLHASISENF